MSRTISFTITDHPSGGRIVSIGAEGYGPDASISNDVAASLAHLSMANGAEDAPGTLTGLYTRAMELLQPENHAHVRRTPHE